MTNESGNAQDFLTEEYIELFKKFKNIYHPPESNEVNINISGKNFSFTVFQYIMFIGITEKHLAQSIDYIEKHILMNFKWIDIEILNSIYETFANIQSATLHKSLFLLMDKKKRISSDRFMVKIEVCERFLHMDIIEHGENFDYFKYDKKRFALSSRLENDTVTLPDFNKLSDTPKKLMITKKGKLKIQNSHGLGLSFIEDASDGDHYIATVNFDRTEDFCKIIRFRLENKNFVQ